MLLRRSTFFAAIAALLLAMFATVPDAGAQVSANSTKSDKLTASFKAVLDKAERSAVALALKYLDPISDMEFTSVNCDRKGDSGQCTRFLYKPEFDLNVGEDGLFQSINAKLTGELMLASVGLDEDGDPNVTGIRHVFPFAAGVETTRFADSFALIAEAGYVPYDPEFGTDLFGNQLQLGFNPYFGVFVQGGYKFDESSGKGKGDSEDQSSEPGNDAIFRLKADLRYAMEFPPLAVLDEEITPLLLTWAKGWYDVAHDDFYYTAGATLRIPMPGTEDTNIDFTFQEGSGEPNFNEGEEFSMGLTFTL
jgi:hypothetical protein